MNMTTFSGLQSFEPLSLLSVTAYADCKPLVAEYSKAFHALTQDE